MAICRACPYSQMNMTFRTCGPLGRPTAVEGGTLCGCVMDVKTRLRTSKCPIGKWESQVRPETITQLQKFFGKNASRITAQEARELTKLYEDVTGTKRAVTMCSSCLADMIQEMRIAIREGLK